MTRKPLSKKTRFEVFKRDSFKCQYCGATAPEAVLHVDHIKPVADGGENEIVNLVTACSGCNLGKGARPLDDASAVNKQRAQLEELQERREQLEMMMEWASDNHDLQREAAQTLADHWHKIAPITGYQISEAGVRGIRRWLRNFSFAEVMAAMDASADQYLRFNDDGTVTLESWEKGFTMIKRICEVERASQDDPDLKDLLYIRAILRRRLTYYFPEREAMEFLRFLRELGVKIGDIREAAIYAENWTQFKRTMQEKAGGEWPDA